VTDAGQPASYSEPCAALLVMAPSSGGTRALTTTDLVGAAGASATDSTASFGGTSGAASVAGGAVALMLARNPALTWRDVQAILRQTSVRLDPADEGWTGGALPHHHVFGFGLLDARAAVQAAASWVPLPGESALAPVTRSPGLAIPDDNVDGIDDRVVVSGAPSAFRVEHVEVDVNISHTYRGDLVVMLVSPSGETSVLAAPRYSDSGDGLVWRFQTVRHWGEAANGTWTLQVLDSAALDVGTLNSWTLRIYGSESAGR
jgi:subtilisin-like proprotein convertase family protein